MMCNPIKCSIRELGSLTSNICSARHRRHPPHPPIRHRRPRHGALVDL
jgi:hypothetical protein